MSTVVHYDTLAEGVLGTTPETVLYTCPPGKSVLVKNIIYVNGHSTFVLCNLTKRKNGIGSSRYLFPKDMRLEEQESAEEDQDQTMQAGDTIRGWCSVDMVMTFVMNGMIKDIP